MKPFANFKFIAKRRQEAAAAAAEARREETRAMRRRLMELHLAEITELNEETARTEERRTLAIQRDASRSALRAALVAERDALQVALDDYHSQHKG